MVNKTSAQLSLQKDSLYKPVYVKSLHAFALPFKPPI